jgi:amino acid permease
MLSLTVTAIGGGVLSLPYVCKLCGLFFGLLLLISGYGATLWSFSLMISADIATGGHKEFKNYILKCTNRKVYKVFDLTTIFYLYGSLVGYQILISNLIQSAIELLEVQGHGQYRIYHIVLVSILVFPLCLAESVSAIRHATFITLVAICYTAILLVIQMFTPSVRKLYENAKLEFIKFDWGIFNAFGITFFAFTCQAGFYSAIDKLKKRDEMHKTRIAFRACTINLFFYLIIILSGYLSSYDKTPDVILSREVPKEFNIPVMIAQILISCGLCIGIPVNYFPLRKAIFNQTFGDSEYTKKRAIITAAIFSSSSCILAILLPEISSVLSILGGFGCVTICFVIPMIAYINVLHERRTQTIVSYFLCSIVIGMGLGSCMSGFYRIIGI